MCLKGKLHQREEDGAKNHSNKNQNHVTTTVFHKQTLLVLRVDRRMTWDAIAAVLGGGVKAPTARKRFERLKERLRLLADREGLLSR